MKNLRNQIKHCWKNTIIFFANECIEVIIRSIALPIIRGLHQVGFLARNGFALWTCNRALWLCNSESSGIHTCVRMYEKRIQWEVQRRLLAVNTEDGEIARRWKRHRQRDLILLSDAHPGNMILSTEGARARMRVAKNHPHRTPPHPEFSTPLLSAAHRLAARSPV